MNEAGLAKLKRSVGRLKSLIDAPEFDSWVWNEQLLKSLDDVAWWPGLDELQACVNDWDNYHEGFNQMMEDEDNDGVNPPKRPAKEVIVL